MFVLESDIQIITAAGRTLSMRRVSEVVIESSAEVLEDTARVVLPTTARLVRAGEESTEVETAKQFSVGDQIVIQLGYDGRLEEEFVGYVSKIKPTTPLELECVDATWLLRRKNLKESFKNVDLGTLLEAIVEGTPIELRGEVPKIQFKTFYFKNVSAAYALQEIKEKYGLTIFLKNGYELHVGLKSYTDDGVVKYEMGRNVIENDLEWVSEDDTRIRVKAVHIRKDNTRIEKEVGDAEGELRTLYFYNIDNKAALETLAKQEIQKQKYSGYKGGFTTFLRPYCEVGNIADLNDPDYAERNGRYLITKVVTTFNSDGARRDIELGLKV
jgi:hypothetical protein